MQKRRPRPNAAGPIGTHAEHCDLMGGQNSNCAANCCAGITAAPPLDAQSVDDRYATLDEYSERSAVNPGNVLVFMGSSILERQVHPGAVAALLPDDPRVLRAARRPGLRRRHACAVPLQASMAVAAAA